MWRIPCEEAGESLAGVGCSGKGSGGGGERLAEQGNILEAAEVKFEVGAASVENGAVRAGPGYCRTKVLVRPKLV